MSNRLQVIKEIRRQQVQSLDMWGGVECTVNRVNDTYLDQLQQNGHHHRLEDLLQLAGLGLKALRYPVIWERVAPNHPDERNWQWTDERLPLLKALGIRPIAGLVHHGCGPRYAAYDSPDFERELPRFARQVAERYPWIDAYTPVNEPLTTARFSGLYGHWYPHRRSKRVFAQILMRECRATVLSMQQIRQVQPAAQLIQTDDLGYTHSTPLLAYQAEEENNRRWLSWDLLCGKVTPQHPMWTYLRNAGISERELWFLVENPCPPSVIGINHYLTSERYLDERMDGYAAWQRGGNGRHRYVDTEVTWAAPHQRLGIGELVRQAWERYKLPIVVTEAHLGGSSAEQIHWLVEVWEACQNLKLQGVDIRAVTAWSLLGSYDWNLLHTGFKGYYEPGAFAVSEHGLTPTPLAELIRCLAKGECYQQLMPEERGWWQAESLARRAV